MEHIVSIKNFYICYTVISCELEFPSSKGDKKSFFVYLNFENRIIDCVTKDKDGKRVWFREFATFLFRKFKRDVEYCMDQCLIDTKLNWEDYLAIFKMILYLAIERDGLPKYRLKDFCDTTYNMFYDGHDKKYTFNSYKDEHKIYPSENESFTYYNSCFKLPNLVYNTICKLYPIQERLSKFFFYNSYDTAWLTDKRSDWAFLDDNDRVEFKNKIVCDLCGLIQKMHKYLFGHDYCCKELSIKKLGMENEILTSNEVRFLIGIKKESNMEIFISKKKKDGSLYLVDKCGNKAVSIKLPDELKKAFEKAASIKLKDDKEISLLPNKILLYRKSGNTKEDLEKTKSIILSWLPEEKYRKMLFTSFVLLLIKIKSKHISIDKDIFERFKITDTKASYDKLYDIADLLIKVKFDKYKYKAMKEDFSLD